VVHSEAFHALKEKGLHIEAVQVYNIYKGFDWLCQRERDGTYLRVLKR
jgi:hypothetical protein